MEKTKHKVSIKTRKAWEHTFNHKPSYEEIIMAFCCDLMTLDHLAEFLIVQGETVQGGNT